MGKMRKFITRRPVLQEESKEGKKLRWSFEEDGK